MKTLFLLSLALAPGFAQAATLEIVNESGRHAAIGEFKGIKVPSICKDGFCWEEINVKLRPYRGYENIRGSVTVNVDSLPTAAKLVVEGHDFSPVDLVGSCSKWDEERRGYFFELKGSVRLSEIGMRSICVADGPAELILD